jgi:hypothetical protein
VSHLLDGREEMPGTLQARVRAMARRVLRGKEASRTLARMGIEPVQFWILTDLWDTLSDRCELMGQVGRDGVRLKSLALIYGAITGLLAVLQVLLRVGGDVYRATFLAITALLLLLLVTMEASSSLVNPAEGLVLAHYPIQGATYTAAKLTHLAALLGYVIPAINLLPAVGTLLLKEARWWHPLAHLALAAAVGVAVALGCCAVLGILMRYMAPSRLKTVTQLAQSIPMMVGMFGGNFGRWMRGLHLGRAVSAHPKLMWLAGVSAAAMAVAAVVFGIRSLSGDYLVRVAAIVHGRRNRTARPRRRTPVAEAIARIAGGELGSQHARAGFEFVRRMAARDWQFRQQMLPMIPMVLVPLGAMFSSPRTTPFGGRFTPLYFLPHAAGILLLLVCTILPQGSDYKGSWLFLTVHTGAFRGFVRGVWAALFTAAIVAPNLLVFAVFVWFWGPRDALLFMAYNMAVGACWLAVELRLVDGLPFSKPVEAPKGFEMVPVMMLVIAVIAAAVGLQHFVLFRSRLLVLAAAAAMGGAAWLVTRGSLNAFELAVRHHLGQAADVSGSLFREV